MAQDSTKQNVIEGIADQLQHNKTRSNGHKLGLHQEDALNDVRDWLTRPIDPSVPNNTRGLQGKQYDSGTVDMATGTGKTWIELAIAAGAVARGEKVVIASPRLRINKQIQDAAAHPERFGLPPGSIVRYDDDASSEERDRVIKGNAPVILTTPTGFRNLDRDGVISSNPKSAKFRGLIEFDESDLFDGDKTGLVARKYRENSVVLAFSATNFDTNARLFDNQPTIHDLPIHDVTDPKRGAVKRGLLVPGIKTGVLEVTPNEGDVQRLATEARTRVEISQEAAEEYARNQAVINEVIRFHGNHVDEHLGSIQCLPTLITVPTRDAAVEVAEAFNKAYGRRIAAAADGNTPPENILDPDTGEILHHGLNPMLDHFNRGDSDLRVLVYPEVLGRGVDIPNATVMISMRPYLRPSPVVQDLGRLTRKGTEDFEQRFGVPKNTVLAVNVQTPDMNPYQYSQVIGGPILWQSGPARPYKPSGPTPPHPEVPPMNGTVRTVTEFNELNRLYQDAETAARERAGIIPEGFITVEEAATRTGATVEQIERRLNSIKPNEQYTTLGLKPGAEGGDPIGTPTVSGRNLKDNKRGQKIVNTEMVERWQQKIAENLQKLDAVGGGATAQEIAERHGLSTKDVRASDRKIDEQGKREGEKKQEPTSPESTGENNTKDDHRTRARRSKRSGEREGPG